MKVVIPMSGEGKRFSDAGYKDIKPLIMVDGKTMAEHVIGMFPKKSEFVFVAREDHLKTTKLKNILQKNAPDCTIIPIKKHKLGPVHAVLQAAGRINDNEPVIVNYCDFYAEWDFGALEKKARQGGFDGALSGYTGFHPHLLWQNLYAGMRVDGAMNLLEIKEKHSFTQNPMDSYHSAGTYYFAKGAEMKKYMQELVERELAVNGEYYVSSVYALMLRDKKKVFVQNVDYFLQWGTPKDLEEYLYWSKYFSQQGKNENAQAKLPKKTTLLMPMAGLGKRFSDAGYAGPKPLIMVDGKPMFMHALDSLPQTGEKAFVCLKKHEQEGWIEARIKRFFPEAKITLAEDATKGQASSCMLAEKTIDPNSALLIAACDNKITFDAEKFAKMAGEKGTDAIIFTFRNNPAVQRKPEAYGYVKTDGENAVFVSCKKPISKKPMQDHAVTGIFYFSKAQDFFDSAREMIRKGRTVNGEYYADTVPNELLEKGKNVKVLEAGEYIVLGTPQDLKTYGYWKNYFEMKKGRGT